MTKLPRLVLSSAILGFLSLGAYAQGPVTVYQAQGTLSDYDPATSKATLDCNAIAGYMPAKTAVFVAHDTADFTKMIPGDIVSFQLCVSGIMTWIEHATRIGSSPDANKYLLAPMLKEVAERKQRKLESVTTVAPPRLAVGDAAPDVELTDQSGHTMHLSDLKGQAVAVTFMYTSCPMANFCPVMSQNFARTQDLMARLGAGDRWRLLSISMDPTHDTSPVLASYASAMHADQAHWTFATGDEAKISAFGAPFGLEFSHTGGVITHNLCTAVIDPMGNIHSIYYGSSWTPQQLASDLRASMQHRTATASL